MTLPCPSEKELIPFINSSNHIVCPSCDRTGGILEVAHGPNCGFVLRHFEHDVLEAYSFVTERGTVAHRGSSYTPGHPLFKHYLHHQKAVIPLIVP